MIRQLKEAGFQTPVHFGPNIGAKSILRLYKKEMDYITMERDEKTGVIHVHNPRAKMAGADITHTWIGPENVANWRYAEEVQPKAATPPAPPAPVGAEPAKPVEVPAPVLTPKPKRKRGRPRKVKPA